MNKVTTSPRSATLDVILWETGRSIPSCDQDADMPIVVVCTTACRELSVALIEARLEGDIRYLFATTSSGVDVHKVPPFQSAVPTSISGMRDAGLVFIALNPKVDHDLSVAYNVARGAREAGLFVAAVVVLGTVSGCIDRALKTGLLREFDSVISLRDEWGRARLLARDLLAHIAGGLKVAPPVCTDLADVHAILRGAIVSVGVGEATGLPKPHGVGREIDAADRAIRDVGHAQIESATGIIVAIEGDRSVRLLEISRATRHVGDLVSAGDAAVIPTVHIEPATGQSFRIMLLAAYRPISNLAPR